REGDTVQLRGLTGVIARGGVGAGALAELITSNTSGSFTEPWQGPTGTFPYRMRYLSNDARFSAKAQALIELLASGNVEAFAAINSIADTIAYFTGAGTMARTGLTPFARSLLDDIDAPTALGTLGLTGNSIANMMLSTYGIYEGSSTDSNLNNLVAGDRGLFTWTAGGVGFPENVGIWWVETQVLFSISNALRQIATWYNPAGGYSRMYVRTKNSGTGVWGDWLCLTGGTRGANSNGVFYRYADGTQLCVSPNLSIGPISTQTGAYWRADRYSWVFPAGFIADSCVVFANDTVSSDILTSCTSSAGASQSVINFYYYQAL